ncbi:MAG: histidine kinase [Thermoleophilaceae bacterium]|nr:histidine kinase [Thermoleophilaceae bacterium]
MCRQRRVETDPPRGGFVLRAAPLRSAVLVSPTTTAQRLFATRPRSGWLVDVTIAAAALAGSLALISHGGVPGSTADEVARVGDHREALADLADLDSLGVALSVCASVPLVAWRWSPIAVFAVTAGASALLVGLGYPLGIPLGAAAALYLLAASRDEGTPWTRRTTAVALLLFGAYAVAAGAGRDTFPASELLHGGVAFALAWFAGDRTRLRREHIAELKERAARAEREAEHERRLAVAEERARIARDLHDAAGHAANVIAVRAGAARMRRDPERSQAALEMIEEIARQTAAEIDGIVGTLRDQSYPNGAADAPLGLASLDTLIARHSAAGLHVTVANQGLPRPLENATDQAAYRILQEALTNAARHGTGAARVELAFVEAALELTISNPAPRAGLSRRNGGHGLIGMRERAVLLGGSFEAERANGAFRVRVRLPYGGPNM